MGAGLTSWVCRTPARPLAFVDRLRGSRKAGGAPFIDRGAPNHSEALRDHRNGRCRNLSARASRQRLLKIFDQIRSVLYAYR